MRAIEIPPRNKIVCDEVLQDTENMRVEIFTDKGGEPVAWENFYSVKFEKLSFRRIKTEIEDGDRYIRVTAGESVYTLDKTSGILTSVKAFGKELGAIRPNVWRAPIDNDMNEKADWYSAGLNRAVCDMTDYKIKGNSVTVGIRMGDYSSWRPWLTLRLRYEFSEEGVRIRMEYLTAKGYFLSLPRIGFRLSLPAEFTRLRYCAYGPGESYNDLYTYCAKGEYTSSVCDEYVHYVRPQECGSHWGADYAEVTDGDLIVRAEGMRSFSALPYSQETLTATAHDDELPENAEGTFFCADLYMGGLGTNSCGPAVRQDRRVPESGSGTISFFWSKK